MEHWHTLAQFFLTGGALGPLFAAALGAGSPRWLAVAAASLAGLKLVLVMVRFLGLIASDRIELRGTRGSCPRRSNRIHPSRRAAGGRRDLAAASGDRRGHEPPAPHDAVLLAAAWAVATAGEILERYLFFVSTVPTHLAAPYLSLNEEAA